MRNIEFLMELVNDVKRDMDRAGIPYNDKCYFELNPRLSRCLGRCHYTRGQNRKAFKIDIQTQYFMTGKVSDIKNTICHELIHSAPRCVNEHHGGYWKLYAEKMNCFDSNYHVSRLSKAKYDDPRKKNRTPYKYIVYCPECGAKWKYKTRCEIVKKPEKWQCCKCKSKLKSKEIGE